MNEEGTIESVSGDFALVRVKRSSACGSCGSKGACHSLGGGADMEVEVRNSLGGGVGDRVRLELPSASALKIAFLLYLVPVITLVFGAAVGHNLGNHFSCDPDLSALLVGAVFFAAVFMVIRNIGQKLSEKKEYRPEMTELLTTTVGDEEDSPPDPMSPAAPQPGAP